MHACTSCSEMAHKMGLSAKELKTFQQQLRRRYARCGVVEVGFGIAKKKGANDTARGLTATFFVKRKYTPRLSAIGLPASVTMNVRRGGEKKSVKFWTDVVELGRAIRTGAPMSPRCRITYPLIGGTIIRWREAQLSAALWGIVTVGHPFAPVSVTNPIQNRVCLKGGFGSSLAGSLIWRSNNPAIDAAAILVAPADLVATGILSDADPDLPGIGCRSVAALVADASPSPFGGSSGQTLRFFGGFGLGFRVAHFFPVISPDPTGLLTDLEGMENVIKVESADGLIAGGVFPKGTSGSAWEIQGMLGAIQIGAESPTFNIGYGQAAQFVMSAIAQGLSDVSSGSVSDFTIVGFF